MLNKEFGSEPEEFWNNKVVTEGDVTIPSIPEQAIAGYRFAANHFDNERKNVNDPAEVSRLLKHRNRALVLLDYIRTEWGENPKHSDLRRFENLRRGMAT
ncbi:MAG TPA: hypothetical protein VLF68_00775 [Candidatus Saccharimonadales bacterium]|nr:hypothetical protein [Candidatus Saccharimonadales bacterium]